MHQQRVPRCVFHRHEVPDKSEFLCECAELNDILYLLGLQKVKEKNDLATQSLAVCPVATELVPRESLSMTASHAEYTSLTRCHTVEGLTGEQVTQFWQHAVVLAAKQIMNTVSGSLRRGGTPVVGVFLMRSGAAEFTVGLITQGTPRDVRLQDALLQFCDKYTLTKTYAELPLCAAHRAKALRLWWEPRTERVTPRRVMPPIKVILEEPLQPKQNITPFCGYAAVNVFLCRPAASRLCGSTRRLLGAAGCGATDKVELRVTEKQDVRGAAFAEDDAQGASSSANVKGKQQRIVVFYFDDLYVVEEGEHLIGVQVETLPSYRAFIPALYGHLAPFLVVGREDA